MDKDDLIKEAEAMGAALLPLNDVMLILGVDAHGCNDILNAYTKGVKTTQYKLNKIIIEQALQGSKPAQDMAITLLDQINMHGRVL